LSLLYEAETKGISPAAVLDELPVPPDPYVSDVVAGVGRRAAEIDALIAGFSIDWSLDRMPAIDRTLLRMGTYELLGRPDVPTGVIMSEAVDLAREYSTDESSRFVNGVLASVAVATRGDSDPGRAPDPKGSDPKSPDSKGPDSKGGNA
jgi:transcription antitermination protein NusB